MGAHGGARENIKILCYSNKQDMLVETLFVLTCLELGKCQESLLTGRFSFEL